MAGFRMPRWKYLLLAVVSFWAVRTTHSCCANACSGHGSCNSACVCTCYSQWTSNDCSERKCPSGLQWAGDASATDSIHHTYAECSNAGSCDRNTGLCSCQTGFSGMACERMDCPSDCNGHGTCVSLKNAAERKDDRNFFRETSYSTQWEAHRIFGCQCDIGYKGYACQDRACPHGDDPLTTGQADEVQVIDCECDTCSGSFYLSYKGEVTGAIPHDGDATTLKAALEALSQIHGVTVALTGGSTLCDSDGVSAAVTFTHNPGDVPQLRIYHSGLAAGVGQVTLENVHSGQTSSEGVSSVVGTKENLECNGRGTCDASTGKCTCHSGFSSSDRAGSQGFSGDCGYSDGSVSSCHLSCSSHGTCSNSPLYTCTCDEGYSDIDCSKRDCPKGRAWFAEPAESLPGYVSVTASATAATTTADLRTYLNRGDTLVIDGNEVTVSTSLGDTFDASNLPLSAAYPGATVTYAEAYGRPEKAHHELECSNMGTCTEAYGTCLCRSGFGGSACQRINCPNDCSGRGVCMSLAELAKATDINGDAGSYTYGTDPSNYATWDHSSLFGCKCDQQQLQGGNMNSIGHDCSDFACPTGDDPGTAYDSAHYRQLEVQTITCSATGGTFTISFRGETTAAVAYNADAATVKSRLEALSTIGTVTVTLSTGSEACSSSGVGIAVQFDTELGNLPIMTTGTSSLTGGTSTAGVVETTRGDNSQMHEVQTIRCTATSGSFKVAFRKHTTTAIAHDADTATVKAALETLPSIRSAIVTFGSGSVACSGAGVDIAVNFTGNLGDLPMMTTDVTSLQAGAGTAVVSETKKGTYEDVECSHHGNCDRTSGVCKCFDGYVSGDGSLGWGTRGDCSYRNEFFVNS